MYQKGDKPSQLYKKVNGGIKVKLMTKFSDEDGELYGFGSSPLMTEEIETKWKATIIAESDTLLAVLHWEHFKVVKHNVIWLHSV